MFVGSPIPSAASASAVPSPVAGHGGTSHHPVIGATARPDAGVTPSAGAGGLEWADVHPSQPVPALFHPSLAYDDSDGYLLLFGGCGGVLCSSPSNQTWIYANGTWSELQTAVTPPAREEAMMTYDAAAGYILLFGGRGSHGSLSDTWAFHDGAWEQLTPVASPSPRAYGNLVYDSADSEDVLFGGYACYTGCGTWVFANDNWTELNITDPPWRYAAAMAYSPPLGEVVLFGGVGNGGGDWADTWTFHGGAWGSGGAGPALRSDPEMGYDGALGQVLLFGGTYVTLSNFPGVAYADTWTFSGSGWQKLTPSVAPPSLAEGALSYDGPGSYAVEVGGCGPSACASGETWVVGPTAAITVLTAPAGCGTVQIAGSSLSDKASVSLPDGAYQAIPAACSHYEFATLAGSGGVTAGGSADWFTASSDGTLTVTFSPAAYQVRFATSPASCGTVSVDGSVVSAATAVDLTYGTYNLSVSGCGGMSLTGWSANGTNLTFPEGTGNLAVLLVAGNGTVTAEFGPATSLDLGSIASIPVLDLIVVAILAAAAAAAVVFLRRRRSRPASPATGSALPSEDTENGAGPR